MHIPSVLAQKASISLEIFPPKPPVSKQDSQRLVAQMTALQPSFISVTYGALGNQPTQNTFSIAGAIQKAGVPALAHLTSVGKSTWQISELLHTLTEQGVENILALRGDLPDDSKISHSDFPYAKDLIARIAQEKSFCIGAACYPEGHPLCPDPAQEDTFLLQKQQAGATFLIGQLCYDNYAFYRFRERIAQKGLTLPIAAGIMPILSRAQLERMTATCKIGLPAPVVRILSRFSDSPASLRAAAFELIVKQAEDLRANGVAGIHFYTMNQPQLAKNFLEALTGPIL